MQHHTINFQESVVNNNLHLKTTLPPQHTLNIVTLFKPYYDMGFRIIALNYSMYKGSLTATLKL